MAMEKISRGQAPRKSSVDFSRIRRPFQGKPVNFISFGVVGHYDLNPAFVRVENDKVLVEVTLMPSGDEIVAELGMEGQGCGYDWYVPICLGSRVVVAFPQGEDEPIIIKRVTDKEFPFPTDVAGIPTVGTPVNPLTGSTAAPHFAFIRVPDGTLLAIEAGTGGDIIIKSGGNLKIETGGGGTVHINSQVHLGDDFSTPPTGASTGPMGEIIPGVPAVPAIKDPHIPVPALVPNVPLPPPTGAFADSIVRVKDAIQSDITVDPGWWAFITALYAHPLIGPVLAAAGIVLPVAMSSASKGAALGALGTMGVPSAPGTPSRHTASD
jgi:hypothetical protein